MDCIYSKPSTFAFKVPLLALAEIKAGKENAEKQIAKLRKKYSERIIDAPHVDAAVF